MRSMVLKLCTTGVAVLSVIVLLWAICFTSRQLHEAPVTLSIDTEDASERLAEALRFQTVSQQNAEQFDGSAFLDFHTYLQRAFPNVHASLTKEIVGGYSLLFTWSGSEPSLLPLLLMAHLDVVPAEPQTINSWTYPPFHGCISDGFIWGRGGLDDKATVVGLLEAIELLLRAGAQPRRTIHLAFGHDEEVDNNHRDPVHGTCV